MGRLMEKSLYEHMLGIICSVFDAYTAVLFLPSDPDRPDRAVTLESAFSLGVKVEMRAEIAAGQGLVGWIVRNRQPLLVPNFDRRKNYLGYYLDNEEQNIKAFMGCSLPRGLGVLCVDSKRQYSFSEKDQKMLHLFAEYLASIYLSSEQDSSQEESLRYYAALRQIYALRHEHSRWLEFLHGFLDVISKASGYEYCAMCTRLPGTEGFSVEGENYPLANRRGPAQFSLNSGMVGWVFRNSTPLVSGGAQGAPEAPLFGRFPDVPAFQSIMAVPLSIQRNVRGVLCLASEAPAGIGPQLQEFVNMAAEHLSLFLENLYIKSRLRDFHHNAGGASPA